MKSNPNRESSSSIDRLVTNERAENDMADIGEKKERLRNLFFSLSHKLEELSRVNEKFFQMIDSPVEENVGLMDSPRGVSGVEITGEVGSFDPSLIYRLSYLMDFLRPRLGFQNAGVFLVTGNDSDIERLVLSPTTEESQGLTDFEAAVKAQWRCGNVWLAITKKKKMAFAYEKGNLLILPLQIAGKNDGVWVMQFESTMDKSEWVVSPGSESSSDLLFCVDLIEACFENSYLKRAYSPQVATSEHIARERHQTIVQLARAMVHEINNCLQIILGRTQILKMNQRKPTEPASGTKALDMIEGNASQISSILKDFSDFLHRQSDGLAAYKELNFKRIMESSLVMLKYIFKSAHIDLELSTEADLPMLCGDPAELEIAYLSLLWGIRDGLPSGGSVRLRTFKDGESICLAAHCAGKNGRSNLSGFENDPRFSFVSQILGKHQGRLSYQSPGGPEKSGQDEERIVMTLPVAQYKAQPMEKEEQPCLAQRIPE
ncbi:MAG: hypothetical protein WCE90_05770 [Candidatus Zixiibacteriota bacterium]